MTLLVDPKIESLKAPPAFRSFLQAGFECSTHRTKSGRRLDLTASTRHDALAKQDYRRLLEFGIKTVREGLRWHLIELRPGQYDFTSVLPLLDAAEETGMEQIIDLFHFGWPEFLDVFAPEFVDSFAQLAFNFAQLLRSRGVNAPCLAPMNEMSFVSWAGGDIEYIYPFERGRGGELKRQLVRASLEAVKAFRSLLPKASILWPEPMIHVVSESPVLEEVERAERSRLAMFEVWDMLSGRLHPELGGSKEVLQMIGVNFYDRNQWTIQGRTLSQSNPLYRPFHLLLQEVWERYRVPIMVSETGTEDEHRADWFAYVAQEVRRAMEMGVRMEGLCLYPIVNHPGWDDDRHCHNGLFDYPGQNSEREMYQPLAREIARQQNSSWGVYNT